MQIIWIINKQIECMNETLNGVTSRNFRMQVRTYETLYI